MKHSLHRENSSLAFIEINSANVLEFYAIDATMRMSDLVFKSEQHSIHDPTGSKQY